MEGGLYPEYYTRTQNIMVRVAKHNAEGGGQISTKMVLRNMRMAPEKEITLFQLIKLISVCSKPNLVVVD